MVVETADWEIIGFSNDGVDAVKKIPLLAPDIVLMDLDMPRMNGLQATGELLKIMPNLKIVILTLHHDKSILKKAVAIGASGYILKNSPRAEFLKGLEMVRSGQQFYSSLLTESMLDVASIKPKKETNVKLYSLLSDREKDILALVAEGHSTRQMAEQLHLSPKTIETYRKSLLDKLDARNSADLIRIAIREGFVDP